MGAVAQRNLRREELRPDADLASSRSTWATSPNRATTGATGRSASTRCSKDPEHRAPGRRARLLGDAQRLLAGTAYAFLYQPNLGHRRGRTCAGCGRTMPVFVNDLSACRRSRIVGPCSSAHWRPLSGSTMTASATGSCGRPTAGLLLRRTRRNSKIRRTRQGGHAPFWPFALWLLP